MNFHVSPAYGRDYKNRAAIETDLLAEKDFLITTFGSEGLINLQQTKDGDIITVRYGRARKQTVFYVGGLKKKQASATT